MQTAWPFLGLLLSITTAAADCVAAPSLLAVKSETQVTQLSITEDLPLNLTGSHGNSTNGTNGTNNSLEKILVGNLAHVLKQVDSLGDMENASNQSDGQRRHGFGDLGTNLEFLLLKVAQMETAEIDELRAEVRGTSTASNTTTSLRERRAKEKAQVLEASRVFKKVIQKHHHQRQTREYLTPHSKDSRASKASKAGKAAEGEKAALLERSARQKQESKSKSEALDAVVSSKFFEDVGSGIADVAGGVAGAVTDGTGLVGDALGDAYEAAADQVSFVANTVIDTVEMAVTILLRGFTDFGAGCPDSSWPSMGVDSTGFRINWGRQKCYIRLMGQSITLFDFNFGNTNVNWPEPVRTVVSHGLAPIRAIVDIGREVAGCVTAGGVGDVFGCFGNKLLQVVPPLSFLTRMGDMLTEFVEVFAHLAGSVISSVLSDSQSLVQSAIKTSFPEVGAPARVHHSTKNLVVKTHTQRHPGSKRSKLHRGDAEAQLQLNTSRSRGDDDDDSDGAINFEISDNGDNYATKLITQFGGKEVDTSSCLAFAPKTRRGSNSKVTQRDWQVEQADQFIQLEPWAVPCDNSWMTDNPEKWEGYSFYTWESAIEKCVTVGYSMSTQPVLAFVGGLEFDLLPAPLADLETTVCRPDKQPSGVDLSVLRTVIKSSGVQLFSRTMRLTKRFGTGTDFTDANTYSAHETWRNPLGKATGTHGAEDDRSLEPINRTVQPAQLVQESTEEALASASEGDFSFRWSEDELQVASMFYDSYLSTNLSEHLRDAKAREHLDLMQTNGDFELFSFRNPGLVSFNIKGVLTATDDLQLLMQVSFGPFTSPLRRVTLVNIVDQFLGSCYGT
ncbi:carA2 [Symbiodinium necroappetens]|uniref:CarA2 protein n=1 Tax=Symbiodinium necroappetens TaxID=1628268 RepID=A0A813CSS7_9DINO|nr:carA2 [Symbiodinium necroappetens]